MALESLQPVYRQHERGGGGGGGVGGTDGGGDAHGEDVDCDGGDGGKGGGEGGGGMPSSGGDGLGEKGGGVGGGDGDWLGEKGGGDGGGGEGGTIGWGDGSRLGVSFGCAAPGMVSGPHATTPHRNSDATGGGSTKGRGAKGGGVLGGHSSANAGRSCPFGGAPRVCGRGARQYSSDSDGDRDAPRSLGGGGGTASGPEEHGESSGARAVGAARLDTFGGTSASSNRPARPLGGSLHVASLTAGSSRVSKRGWTEPPRFGGPCWPCCPMRLSSSVTLARKHAGVCDARAAHDANGGSAPQPVSPGEGRSRQPPVPTIVSGKAVVLSQKPLGTVGKQGERPAES